MVTRTAADGRRPTSDVIAGLARSDGTAAHAFATRLATSAASTRDLADAAHAICVLHGGYPGLIDHCRDQDIGADRPEWLDMWLDVAGSGMAAERARLAQLAVVAGPRPSTPGQAETEAAVAAQRHALETLSRSDRAGCALGAVAGLLLDWPAIRGVLDRAAHRFGVDPVPAGLPVEAATLDILDRSATAPGIERAMMFGAEQVLAQHRGLWSLLEARAAARDRN